MYCFGSLHCTKFFKKPSERIHSYEVSPFLVLKWLVCPQKKFFRKPISKPHGVYSFLSTSKNPNQMSVH